MHAKPSSLNEPLAPLPRHDAELGSLDLFSRLDNGAAAGQLADEARVDAVVARFRSAVLASLRNEARVHGWHTQLMFAEVVRGLGAAVLLSEEDQGMTWSKPSEQARPGDYRVVLPDGRNLSVEVKNHSRLAAPFRMRVADLDALRRYAGLTRSEPKVAIYWTRTGMWFLVDPDRFTVEGDGASIPMTTAMAESEMASLGDAMVGLVPPLEFRIDFEELPPFTELDDQGRREAKAVIRRTSISAGGKQLRSKTDARLAFYLIWNGRWPETQHDDFENDRLKAVRFVFEPQEWQPEQGFAIAGFLSELIARSFWLRTSDEGVVTRLRARLDPRTEGLVIPVDVKISALGLRILRLRPRGGVPLATS
jgi:hypothetical protein